MIAIVDYGAGNLVSVKKAFDWIGQDCAVVSTPEQIRGSSRIVLPGVGHFSSTAALARSGLQDAILEAIRSGIPFLGICVGMQWMYSGSLESSTTPGLGLFEGACEGFPKQVKSPHVGWNEIRCSVESRLLQGLKPDSFVYFTHSYRAPVSRETSAFCNYGGLFAAAVEHDKVFGVQFHPEKSGDAGLTILRNFCSI